MPTTILTPSQIETYLQDGVLVVDTIFTKDEIEAAIHGLHHTLSHEYSIDVNNLLETGYHLTSLSSTNGSGGVLDVFYSDFKLAVGSNKRLFQATTELWKAAYHHDKETLSASTPNDDDYYKYHPYGPFDCNKGYMYIDRIGYRLPSQLSIDIATRMEQQQLRILHTTLPKSSSSSSYGHMKSKKRKGGIQRCLTPHLDCCPDTFYTAERKSKWRPIQCFVSLTDNLEPNTGGFEAALGFHRLFDTWAKHRDTTSNSNSTSSITNRHHHHLCVGEYTHIRPKEDEEVMKAVQHVPVRKGSVVFFDNRIPHANAYRHVGTSPRAVIYCSFLPDVHINRIYAKKQLDDYYDGKLPNDTWIRVKDEQEDHDDDDNHNDHNNTSNDFVKDLPGPIPIKNLRKNEFSFSSLGRKLMMMDPWE
jgi:hypothetical protein